MHVVAAYLRLVALVVLAMIIASACGGSNGSGETSVPTAPDEILQDMTACLERAGAVATIDEEGLDARWPTNANGFVGVSVTSYYEVDDVRYHFPLILKSGRLRPDEEAAADGCYKKYDEAKPAGFS